MVCSIVLDSDPLVTVNFTRTLPRGTVDTDILFVVYETRSESAGWNSQLYVTISLFTCEVQITVVLFAKLAIWPIQVKLTVNSSVTTPSTQAQDQILQTFVLPSSQNMFEQSFLLNRY